MRKVGFIGLGVMGAPMAAHLVRRGGYAVTAYTRDAEKAARWASASGGACAATPREAATGAEIVFACVGDDDSGRAVALGPDGAVAGMTAGAIFVDHTTASAQGAVAVEAAARGLGFLDAPISGGQAGAENGALTVMCGGDPETYGTAAPVIGATPAPVA